MRRGGREEVEHILSLVRCAREGSETSHRDWRPCSTRSWRRERLIGGAEEHVIRAHVLVSGVEFHVEGAPARALV